MTFHEGETTLCLRAEVTDPLEKEKLMKQEKRGRVARADLEQEGISVEEGSRSKGEGAGLIPLKVVVAIVLCFLAHLPSMPVLLGVTVWSSLVLNLV